MGASCVRYCLYIRRSGEAPLSTHNCHRGVACQRASGVDEAASFGGRGEGRGEGQGAKATQPLGQPSGEEEPARVTPHVKRSTHRCTPWSAIEILLPLARVLVTLTLLDLPQGGSWGLTCIGTEPNHPLSFAWCHGAAVTVAACYGCGTCSVCVAPQVVRRVRHKGLST